MSISTASRVITLHFPEGSEWSRWYATREGAAYLGMSEAALRGWVRRYGQARDHFEHDGIQAHRIGRTWRFRFGRCWDESGRV